MVLDLDLNLAITVAVIGASALNTYQHTRTQRDLTELKLFVFQNFIHRRELAPGTRPRVESAPDALDNCFDR